MTRYSGHKWVADFGRGRKVVAETPAKPARKRREVVIDEDALEQAKRELAAAADRPKLLATGGSNTLPATGYCHTCDRAVSGERRFCGPCMVKRGRS